MNYVNIKICTFCYDTIKYIYAHSTRGKSVTIADNIGPNDIQSWFWQLTNHMTHIIYCPTIIVCWLIRIIVINIDLINVDILKNVFIIWPYKSPLKSITVNIGCNSIIDNEIRPKIRHSRQKYFSNHANVSNQTCWLMLYKERDTCTRHRKLD